MSPPIDRPPPCRPGIAGIAAAPAEHSATRYGRASNGTTAPAGVLDKEQRVAQRERRANHLMEQLESMAAPLATDRLVHPRAMIGVLQQLASQVSAPKGAAPAVLDPRLLQALTTGSVLAQLRGQLYELVAYCVRQATAFQQSTQGGRRPAPDQLTQGRLLFQRGARRDAALAELVLAIRDGDLARLDPLVRSVIDAGHQ